MLECVSAEAMAGDSPIGRCRAREESGSIPGVFSSNPP